MKLFPALTDSTDRRRALFFVAAIGLLAGLLLTVPLWTLDRTYPLAPVIPGTTLPADAHVLLLLGATLGLLTAVLWPRARSFAVLVSLLSLGLLVLLDITRLQPWVFHYSAILLLFSFGLRRSIDQVELLDAARIIVGGIYFWSGVQKLNTRFMLEVFPWFTQSLWSALPGTLAGAVLLLGILVPFIEAGFALGFFTVRYRRLAIGGSAAMILLVLMAIGPIGNNWNSSVWPWNVGIFLMVLILFFGTTFTWSEFFARTKRSLACCIAFAVFWILPLGNVFGLTDHYLSWSLYSGHVPEASLEGDSLILSSLSSEADDDELSFTRWTMETMNVVPYPEERVFQHVFAEICADHQGDPTLRLTITQYPFWNSLTYSTHSFDCSHH